MPEHDPSYKLLFSHRELVADLLRGFVREPWVAQLDLSTLQRPRESGISHDLREREDDLIWRVRWGERWLYIYLLLEFQSSVDPLMASRLMTYIGLLYQDLAAAQEIPARGPLPPVLPIVLYNGVETWIADTSLAAMSEPDPPVSLRRWQPQLRIFSSTSASDRIRPWPIHAIWRRPCFAWKTAVSPRTSSGWWRA
jgi:predicted transposase YdaD